MSQEKGEVPEQGTPHNIDVVSQADSDAPTTLSMKLIASRCLSEEVLNTKDENLIMEKMFETTHLYLDRLNIAEVQHFELLNKVTHVYLQWNRIEQLQGFDFMPHLTFLAIFNNSVKKIENIKHLKLEFLDAHNNNIAEIDAGELPKSLRYLDLSGNPCTRTCEYEYRLLEALPNLVLLDGKSVSNSQRSRWGLPENHLLDEEEGRIMQQALETHKADLNGSSSITQGVDQATQLPILDELNLSEVDESIVELEQMTQGILQRSRERMKKLRDDTNKQIDEIRRQRAAKANDDEKVSHIADQQSSNHDVST